MRPGNLIWPISGTWYLPFVRSSNESSMMVSRRRKALSRKIDGKRPQENNANCLLMSALKALHWRLFNAEDPRELISIWILNALNWSSPNWQHSQTIGSLIAPWGLIRLDGFILFKFILQNFKVFRIFEFDAWDSRIGNTTVYSPVTTNRWKYWEL